MIYSVTVTNYLGESLIMELAHPEKSGIIVESIEGIGSGSADINTTELATADGSLFNSARVTERNIVMNLIFSNESLDKESIEEIRHKTYKFFPLKKKLSLIFETDARRCLIDGYVESNEADVFSNKEGCEISIICPNPYFSSINSTKVLFYGVEPLFEFPFSNKSLNEKKLEFGEIRRYTDQNIVYEGDTETGIVVKMHALGPVGDVSIYKISTRESIKLYANKLEAMTGSALDKGDELVVSTVRPSPYVRLFRAGKIINVLNMLDKKSSWIQLTKGDNVFAYSAGESLNNLEFNIEYNSLYEGI